MMSEATDRTVMLAWAMRILGAGFILIILTMFDLWPAGFRWGQPHGHAAYERMIQAIYISLGICLLRASSTPLKAGDIIDFTILSSVLHAGVMTYDAIIDPMERTHLVGDIPLLIAVAALFIWLHPRRLAAS